MEMWLLKKDLMAHKRSVSQRTFARGYLVCRA